MAAANWLALLLAPSLVLAALGINYALVTPVCERLMDLAWLHAVFAASLLLCVLFAGLAWRNWSKAVRYAELNRKRERKSLVALLGALLASLSALVLVAQWLPLWVLSPCSV